MWSSPRLITALGWEYAILITACLVLTCIAFGCLMKPLESTQASNSKVYKRSFSFRKIWFLSLLQKDEQPEEEKPLTLSNGITPGEPEENGKPQNGHIVLSPPVRDIFKCFLFYSFEFLASIERKGWFLWNVSKRTWQMNGGVNVCTCLYCCK